MASTRDIKRRIKSVQSTIQITKAMNLVAASKLSRAKGRMGAAESYSGSVMRIMAGALYAGKGLKHKYTREPGGKRLVAVIAGDRGLCAGYNANVCKEAHELAASGKDSSVVTIGSKARDYFIRRRVDIAKSVMGVSESPHYDDASAIGDYLLKMFESGGCGEVYLAYTEFKSTISHEVKTIRLLPLEAPAGEAVRMNWHEGVEAALDAAAPQYLNTVLFDAMVTSAACEQAARMTAMDTATGNAETMTESLSLIYNRARQGAITQEITEIAGGAIATL